MLSNRPLLRNPGLLFGLRVRYRFRSEYCRCAGASSRDRITICRTEGSESVYCAGDSCCFGFWSGGYGLTTLGVVSDAVLRVEVVKLLGRETTVSNAG